MTREENWGPSIQICRCLITCTVAPTGSIRKSSPQIMAVQLGKGHMHDKPFIPKKVWGR